MTATPPDVVRALADALVRAAPALTAPQAREIADALLDGGLADWADVLLHGWGDVAFKYANGQRVTTDLHRPRRPTRVGA